MTGSLLYSGYSLLQVVERAPASWTRYIFRAGASEACSLQDGEGGILDVCIGNGTIVHKPQSVCQSVHHQCPHVGGGIELECLLVVE